VSRVDLRGRFDAAKLLAALLTDLQNLLDAWGSPW
jgi:hypothetical protein